jgi:hypothetical protein
MIFTFKSRALSNFDSPPSRPTIRYFVLVLIAPVTRPPYFSMRFLHSSRSNDGSTPETNESSGLLTYYQLTRDNKG